MAIEKIVGVILILTIGQMGMLWNMAKMLDKIQRKVGAN